MATVRRDMSASPDQVWEVLSDGWRYSNWVVGTSHMRSVDAHWPEPGSQLEHATGVWPFVLRDSTEVEAAEPPSRLVLIAHGGPLGDARVALDVEATATGSRVAITEVPVSGPGRLMRNPVGHALIDRRNVETLARLAVLAEHRQPPQPS
ncbi:SRPBCC family protein [Jatrophihabitans sp. YIM 134969]